MALKKSDILNGNRKPEIFRLDIPEWGGEIRIKIPTCAEFEENRRWQQKLNESGNGVKGVRARTAIMVCVDEDDKPLFTKDDEAALSSEPASLRALNRITDFVSPMLWPDEKTLADKAKNLPATTGDDSTTD